MHKAVSKDGTIIAYKKTGDGPSIVLINGALRDHTVFDLLVPELEPHFTTYVYDRRGRGESGDAPHYAIQREVEDLEAVIAEADGEVMVFGGSAGANLALEAALAGAPIGRLAVHEPYFRPQGYPRPPDDFMDHLKALLSEGKCGEAIEYWSTDFLELSPEQFMIWRRNPELWEENLARAHTLVYDAILCTMCSDYSVPVGRLAKLEMPTMVIRSDNTHDWLRAAAEATAAALPNCKVVSLPGGWHWVKPGFLAQVLAEFTTV